jgi:16S rRNA (uracil1498-N3)-methyltransferase
MSSKRFFCKKIIEPLTELSGSEAHHLISVLRMSKGDTVELFDGEGTLASATIVDSGKKRSVLQIDNIETHPRALQYKIIIAASIARGDRFSWLIGKLTELGVDRICPVIYEKTIKLPGSPTIQERWRNIAVSAAKQSRRIFVPQIDEPSPLTHVLKVLKEDYPDANFLLGNPAKNIPSVFTHFPVSTDMVAFVGPEAGFTETEHKLLGSHGAQPVRLTVTTLRVETAALSMAVLLTAKRDS